MEWYRRFILTVFLAVSAITALIAFFGMLLSALDLLGLSHWGYPWQALAFSIVIEIAAVSVFLTSKQAKKNNLKRPA